MGINTISQKKIDKYINCGYKLQKHSDTDIRLYKINWLIAVFLVLSIIFICFTVWFILGIVVAIILLPLLLILGIIAMYQVGTVIISITKKGEIEEKGNVLESD